MIVAPGPVPGEVQSTDEPRRSGASLRPALSRNACFLFVFVLPMSLLLQAVGDLLRHIVLVVLGEHAVGAKRAHWIEGAFGNDPLSFPEQLREQALIAPGDRPPPARDLEPTPTTLPPPNPSSLYHP